MSSGSMTPARMPGWRPSVMAVTLQPGTAMRFTPDRRVRWVPPSSACSSSGRPYGQAPAKSPP